MSIGISYSDYSPVYKKYIAVLQGVLPTLLVSQVFPPPPPY